MEKMILFASALFASTAFAAGEFLSVTYKVIPTTISFGDGLMNNGYVRFETADGKRGTLSCHAQKESAILQVHVNRGPNEPIRLQGRSPSIETCQAALRSVSAGLLQGSNSLNVVLQENGEIQVSASTM